MNVLWICTDQQRFDTLGCMGNPWVYTPNLDRLAAEGVLFENTYAQSPVCAPSRGCFLSGRYPRTCGPRQNGQDIGKDEKLVPKMFADHGYYCGLSGKLHLSACHPDTGRMIEPRIDDGYHEFHWSHHPQSWKDVNNWPANEYSQFLMENCVDYVTQNREDCKYVQVGVDEKWHQTTWCADQAIAFMEKCKTRKKSWLFSFNCFDPHHAFDPPAEYLERYLKILDQIPLPNYEPGELENKTVFQQKDHVGAYNTPGQMPYDEMTDYDHRMITAAYWAMVDLIDKQVGRMLDYLEQSGQKEDTLVIFHSDHGENLGDHGMYLKGPYFYENNVHVPLIISWPGKIPGGRKSKALIELADLAPTICEAAGLPLYEGFQGKSFWKILTGESDLNTHRDSVYSEFYNSNINHRNPLAFTTMVCDGRYKLTKVHGCTQGVEGELYDLQEKPLERYNHYNNSAFTEIKVRMLELLADRMAQTCDPLPTRKACW
ncbi:sulfatase-like hydrolase/transferase [Gallintestinimicrobium sp.]|uniref:sulfatase family protein n=2 Tax=Gallintestinimicrobium sp. TaxID=2981655 RepID=UPI00307B4E5C